MDGHKIIVIGCSAGGVEALSTLVSGLPEDLVASVCIAQHIPPARKSALPSILTRVGTLPAVYPPDGMPLQAGTIFLAPPGHNLSIHCEGVVVTLAGQKSSPSIDLLFSSAADSYGPRVIGVILTGLLTDGTVGMQAIKHMGGTTIIQNPLEAQYPAMPRSAQAHCTIDYCLTLAQIAPLLQALSS